MATPDDQNIEDIIFGGESADGQPNLEILMEQYKLFVETSVRRSERLWRPTRAIGRIESCRRQTCPKDCLGNRPSLSAPKGMRSW